MVPDTVITIVNYDRHMFIVQATGLNLSRVFNSRSGYMHTLHFLFSAEKLPNLVLKTWPKKLLGHLPLAFVLPDLPQSTEKVQL
jgi:hypothetical protein